MFFDKKYRGYPFQICQYWLSFHKKNIMGTLFKSVNFGCFFIKKNIEGTGTLSNLSILTIFHTVGNNACKIGKSILENWLIFSSQS